MQVSETATFLFWCLGVQWFLIVIVKSHGYSCRWWCLVAQGLSYGLLVLMNYRLLGLILLPDQFVAIIVELVNLVDDAEKHVLDALAGAG